MAIVNMLPMSNDKKMLFPIYTEIISGEEFINYVSIRTVQKDSTKLGHYEYGFNGQTKQPSIFENMHTNDLSEGDTIYLKVHIEKALRKASSTAFMLGYTQSLPTLFSNSMFNSNYAAYSVTSNIPEGTVYYVEFIKTANGYLCSAYDENKTLLGSIGSNITTAATSFTFCSFVTNEAYAS